MRAMDGAMANSGQPRRASAGSEAAATLAELRRRIDAIDSEILEKLNDRARVVLEVGALKRRTGDPVYSSTRERAIVDRLTAENPGPFPAEGIAPAFREIVSATRSLEDALPVAYFGPEGTFTHLAAKQRFGEVANLLGESSITHVFGAVESGRAKLGVIPVENTTAGVVTETLDTFAESDVSICGEILLKISLDLFSQSGELADVRRIASHPQPLAQSRRWLDEQLPGVERFETASTAAAIDLAAADASVAAIGSSIAGESQGLVAIRKSIQDRGENTTRFLLIGHQLPEATGDDLTTVLFTIRKDEAGGLNRLIEPMAQRGVNLTSIQLRPIAGKPWEYYFFIEFEGHRDDPQVEAALAAAADSAHTCRVLGSFPRAAGSRPRRAGEGA
jgi:chorismate mutase/prephenate dehydratase